MTHETDHEFIVEKFVLYGDGKNRRFLHAEHGMSGIAKQPGRERAHVAYRVLEILYGIVNGRRYQGEIAGFQQVRASVNIYEHLT